MGKSIDVDGWVSNPKCETINGKEVFKFSLNNKRDDVSQWHNFTLWDKMAERLAGKLWRGRYVVVKADEWMREYQSGGETRAVMDFYVTGIRFDPTTAEPAGEEAAPPPAAKPADDDSLPF